MPLPSQVLPSSALVCIVPTSITKPVTLYPCPPAVLALASPTGLSSVCTGTFPLVLVPLAPDLRQE